MRAGELRHRITFQNKTITYDSYNQPIEVWVDDDTVWAEVITSGGSEFYAGQKLNAATSAVFKIRYKNVLVTQRIKFGARYFEILPPINNVDGLNKEILLLGKEVI
jgi:SPP1 family predicted phage head-tail adaptor